MLLIARHLWTRMDNFWSSEMRGGLVRLGAPGIGSFSPSSSRQRPACMQTSRAITQRAFNLEKPPSVSAQHRRSATDTTDSCSCSTAHGPEAKAAVPSISSTQCATACPYLTYASCGTRHRVLARGVGPGGVAVDIAQLVASGPHGSTLCEKDTSV